MIIGLLIGGFNFLLQSVVTALQQIRLDPNAWNYVGTFAAMCRMLDGILPITDGVLPVIGLWIAITNVMVLKKIVVFVVNVVRGSGANI